MVLKEVQQEIQIMKDAGMSYRDIGEKYGVNKGIIHFVLNNGYEPKRKDIRRKLGLEDLTVEFIRQIRTSKGTFADSKVLDDNAI